MRLEGVIQAKRLYKIIEIEALFDRVRLQENEVPMTVTNA